MRLATWNVNSLRVRLPHLTEWLTANPVDVIALQETKLPDADFPAADLQALGWNSAFSGQRTYNGVAILSREPATDVVAGIPGFDDEQRRVLAASLGSLRVVDVYVPNGQTVGSDKFAYKLRWFDRRRHSRSRAQLKVRPEARLHRADDPLVRDRELPDNHGRRFQRRAGRP